MTKNPVRLYNGGIIPPEVLHYGKKASIKHRNLSLERIESFQEDRELKYYRNILLVPRMHPYEDIEHDKNILFEIIFTNSLSGKVKPRKFSTGKLVESIQFLRKTVKLILSIEWLCSNCILIHLKGYQVYNPDTNLLKTIL